MHQHGAEGLAVLHDLLAHAEPRGTELVVETSVREIAERLGFVSKDTVHRRLRQLIRASVVRRLAGASRARFARSAYILDLDNTGIARTTTGDQPHTRRVD
jgi:SOS-response transcriptional repressor LexA